MVDPPGNVHLLDWVDSEWIKQLVAEQLDTIRTKRGHARQELQKMRERSEALDTRVYARAADWNLGADRFDERMWQSLEKQAGVETTAVAASSLRHRPSRRPDGWACSGDAAGASARPDTWNDQKPDDRRAPQRDRRGSGDAGGDALRCHRCRRAPFPAFAAARRPGDRDEIADRLRDGRF
jgi:phage terminase large subunit GpA-like protein